MSHEDLDDIGQWLEGQETEEDQAERFEQSRIDFIATGDMSESCLGWCAMDDNSSDTNHGRG